MSISDLAFLLATRVSRLPSNPCLYAQAETFLQLLDPVVEQLREELPQASYDRKSLGQLIGQLMQFQEDALGVNVISNVASLKFLSQHALRESF